MLRRHLLIGAATVLVASTVPARGAEIRDFDAKTFAAAQEAGHGVVVHVHAPW